MGAPMARHLLEAGHEVTVHNRTREREQPLAELGAARAASPAEAAVGAEAVLTCVSDTPDLLEVLFGDGGAAEGLAAGAVFCRLLDDLAHRHGRDGRSPRGARHRPGRRAGVGRIGGRRAGHADHLRRRRAAGRRGARPVLETFGSRITHLGPAGSGQLAKAVNQVMIAGTYATVGEGIALAEAAGLPLDALVEALGQGAAASWVLENRAANMIDNSYPLGFKVQLHRKDLGIALDEAARLGAPDGGLQPRRRRGGRADRRRARRRGRQRAGPGAPASRRRLTPRDPHAERAGRAPGAGRHPGTRLRHLPERRRRRGARRTARPRHLPWRLRRRPDGRHGGGLDAAPVAAWRPPADDGGTLDDRRAADAPPAGSDARAARRPDADPASRASPWPP